MVMHDLAMKESLERESQLLPVFSKLRSNCERRR